LLAAAILWPLCALAADNSRAQDDASGTGQNNIFKYVAGLNPTNPGSIFTFQIDRIEGKPSRTKLIFQPCHCGPNFTVQSSTNFYSSTFTNLSVTTLQTNSEQVTIIDQDAAQSMKFYRMRITVP